MAELLRRLLAFMNHELDFELRTDYSENIQTKLRVRHPHCGRLARHAQARRYSHWELSPNSSANRFIAPNSFENLTGESISHPPLHFTWHEDHLFNLDEDRGELHDRSKDPGVHGVPRELRRS